MARRIPRPHLTAAPDVNSGAARRRAAATLLAGLAAVALAAGPRPAQAAGPSPLVSYSFEDDVATGPDTFAIYRNGRGHVSLSQAYHVSGYRSVEIRDVAGDKNFPELQGYFPARRTGRLYFHFAFLTTNPAEELNVALAGPRWFVLEKDGISFWLASREGQLVHVSDSIPKKLFPLEAFVWYMVDVAYDLGAGKYSLTIRREGEEEPRVALRDQPNAPRQPGSAVDKFSFVGSPYGDRSNVLYYVDDVVIGTEQSVTAGPFVAPGRRKLFVDLFLEYRRRLQERPRCLPVTGPQDLGLTADDLRSLESQGLLEVLERLLAGKPVEPGQLAPGAGGRIPPVLEAARAWSRGCDALDRGDGRTAIARFAEASLVLENAWIVKLSSVLALTGQKRFAEADDLLALLADSREDPRYAAAAAYLGIARGDLERALAWLSDPAARVLDREANPLLALLGRRLAPGVLRAQKAQLGAAYHEHLEETLVAEQYFYVQLWKEQYDLARDYALRMVARLRRAAAPTAAWSERAGDAAFYGRDLDAAGELYAQGIEAEKDHGVLMRLYLKMADVAHLKGDLGTERALREHYYGALKE
jgi:hypothetical protein